MRGGVRLVSALLPAALLACGPSADSQRGVSVEPVPITDQSDAVCGMLVRDQSAPRAQVVHPDGERAFLCSIGDFLAYLAVPSPHGTPVAMLVEVMDPAEDPGASHTGEHPWLRAEDAAYVVGIPRRGIMGPPVLVYRDPATAQQVAAGTAARVLDFPALKRWWKASGAGSE